MTNYNKTEYEKNIGGIWQMKTTQEILDFYGIEIGKRYKITSSFNSVFVGATFTPEKLPSDNVVLRFSKDEYDVQPVSLLNCTEYEKVMEILDEKEKEYLRNVIKPFRETITGIVKHPFKGKEFIEIFFLNDERTDFPLFEEGTMYKGMEMFKIYTLKELEL